MPGVPVGELALEQIVKRLYQRRNRKRLGGLRAGKTKRDTASSESSAMRATLPGPAAAYDHVIAPFRAKSCQPSLPPTYPALARVMASCCLVSTAKQEKRVLSENFSGNPRQQLRGTHKQEEAFGRPKKEASTAPESPRHYESCRSLRGRHSAGDDCPPSGDSAKKKGRS